MTSVLVDTSALLVHLDADDLRHERVRTAFAELASEDLVTHGYVVAECIAVTRRRLGVDAVIALIDEVLPAIDVIPVDSSVHDEALRRYRSALPTGTSFVDQVSFVVVAREGIGTAFALDGDFASAGVTVVPPP